jgi:serine/threonine protein kinase
MAYPTIEQYQEALQHPATAFVDPLLAKGKIRSSGLGTPLVASGGFALTYGVECGTKKYAVRCFHREAKGLERRYAAISNKIKSLSSDYFVEFEFQAKGVKIGTQTWPIVKMAWATGETLGEFVESNFTNKVKITNLIQALSDLEKFLGGKGIAHGDIQDGNLMVSDNGKKLQLIDYDGMFVPELAPLGSAELGHRDYQHPKRDNTVYDDKLDRFSFISLNLALRSLIEKQDLWRTSQSGAGVIVFKANDYAAPVSSNIFNAISSISSLKTSTEAFTAICLSSYQSIPLLDDFILGKNIPKLVLPPASATRSTPTASTPVGYISQYPVINATNFSSFAMNVGNMVELVGRITQVKRSINRYGKPFIFVNFTDWRLDGVKINLWNNAIDAGGDVPTEAWVGRWVTIKGLVEPPFASKVAKATHISITAKNAFQIITLTEVEARYRLSGGPGTVQGTINQGSNAERLKTLIKPTGAKVETIPTRQNVQPTAWPNNPATPAKAKTPNELALEALRQSGVKTSTRPSPTTSRTGSGKPQPNHPQPPKKSTSNDVSWGVYIFWGVLILFALKLCSK